MPLWRSVVQKHHSPICNFLRLSAKYLLLKYMSLASRAGRSACLRSASAHRRPLLGWSAAVAVAAFATYHGSHAPSLTAGPKAHWTSIAGYSRAVTPALLTRAFSSSCSLLSSIPSSTFTFNPRSDSSMADLTLTPPQSAPKWNHSAEDILKLTKEAIQKDREFMDRIGKLPKDQCNFETVSHRRLYSFYARTHEHRAIVF